MVSTKRIPYNYNYSIENLSNREICFGHQRFHFRRFYSLRLSCFFITAKSPKMKSQVTREISGLGRCLSQQVASYNTLFLRTMDFLSLRQDYVIGRFRFHRIYCIFISRCRRQCTEVSDYQQHRGFQMKMKLWKSITQLGALKERKFA